MVLTSQLGRVLGGNVDDDPDLADRLAAPKDEYCFEFLLEDLQV